MWIMDPWAIDLMIGWGAMGVLLVILCKAVM